MPKLRQHRARLPGAQIRTGPGPLRGAWLARLSPSCHPYHFSLQLPHPRTSCPSPLNRCDPPIRCRSRASKTQRRPRSSRNATCQTRSRPRESGSPSPWRPDQADVPAGTTPNRSNW
jgi:hypothetical protein